MVAAEGFSAQVLSSLDSQLAEVEDMISYTADILTTGMLSLGSLRNWPVMRVAVLRIIARRIYADQFLIALMSDPLSAMWCPLQLTRSWRTWQRNSCGFR